MLLHIYEYPDSMGSQGPFKVDLTNKLNPKDEREKEIVGRLGILCNGRIENITFEKYLENGLFIVGTLETYMESKN